MTLQSRLAAIEAWIDASCPARLLETLKARTGTAPAEPPAAGSDRIDLALAVAIGVVAALVASHAMSLLPPLLYDTANIDVWFQADQSRVLHALGDRASPAHYRDSVHPLFSILAFPPVALLRGLGLDLLAAGQALIVAAAFLSGLFLYLTLRRLGLPRLVGCLGAGMFLASSTFLYWFAIVETYAVAALSTILALWLLARARPASGTTLVVASLLTLSITITNWTLGLALTLMRLPLAKAVRIAIVTLVIGVTLSLAQRAIFPEAGYFFRPRSLGSEVRWTQPALAVKGAASWTPLANVRTVLVSSAAAPRPYLIDLPKPDGNRPIVTNQLLSPASYGPVGYVALASWLAVLGLTVAGIALDRKLTRTAAALGLFLLGQVVLHLVYGDVTFLFAANFFAPLVVLSCFGWFTRFRTAHLCAMVCFLVSGAAFNYSTFRAAAALAGSPGVLRAPLDKAASAGAIGIAPPAPRG